MGKHKKTRQEKIIADLRRKLSLKDQPSVLKTPRFTFQLSPSPKPNDQTSSFIYTHEYLNHDLLKTAFLTSSIVIAEIILFFLSKQQIIKLP